MATSSNRSRGSNVSNQALVRHVVGEPEVIVSFIYETKLHKLCRPKSQTLGKTLQRVALTLSKKDKKKGKPRSSVNPPPPPSLVTLLDRRCSDNIPVDTLNEAAWQDGTWFVIGEQKYKVLVNHPQVKKLELPSLLMVDCPIVPQVEVEFADKDGCKWEWLRINDPSLINESILDLEMTSIDHYSLPRTSVELLHEGPIYWPTQADVGHQLLLQCTPFSSQESIAGNTVYYQTTIVQSGVELKAIHTRQKQTPSFLSSDSLRVVSYNILADQHASSDYSQILYSYCPLLALQTPYRHGLLITELLGYHPDVVCLQEVALKCYKYFLLAIMKEKDFDGIFAQKTGQLHEGEAVFYNLSKYELVKYCTISLKQYIQSAISCRPLFEALENGARSVLRSFLVKPTIIQLVLLKVKGFEDRYLLVANTHLCFHPTEDYIRLLQTIVCTRAISDTIAEFKSTLTVAELPMKEQEERKEIDVGIIFCGDFNSCPCTGGYQYLTSGFLSKTHPDWTKYKLDLIPRCGCCRVPLQDAEFIINTQKTIVEEDQADVNCKDFDVVYQTGQATSSTQCGDFNGLDVSHEFKFQDACGPLDYTHYRDVFIAVLDYIMVDERYLHVDRVVPMPSHDEVTEHVALPSISFPSDHLALICEFKWK